MKIHPTQTYHRLLYRFKGKELSLRKRLCLAYLKWLDTEKPEDRDDFVELAKKFRKGRAGGHRTILERKARENFKKARIRKNTEASREGAREFNEGLQKEKKGIFTEEQLAKRSEMWKEIRDRHRAENDQPGAKTYVVNNPDGTQVCVHGLGRSTREMGLHHDHLHLSAREPWRRKGWKGYSCEYFDPEIHSHLPWAEGYELPPRLREKYGLDDLE